MLDGPKALRGSLCHSCCSWQQTQFLFCCFFFFNFRLQSALCLELSNSNNRKLHATVENYWHRITNKRGERRRNNNNNNNLCVLKYWSRLFRSLFIYLFIAGSATGWVLLVHFRCSVFNAENEHITLWASSTVSPENKKAAAQWQRRRRRWRRTECTEKHV